MTIAETILVSRRQISGRLKLYYDGLIYFGNILLQAPYTDAIVIRVMCATCFDF